MIASILKITKVKKITVKIEYPLIFNFSGACIAIIGKFCVRSESFEISALWNLTYLSQIISLFMTQMP